MARIVAACSDSVVNRSGGESKLPWEERRRRYIANLDTCDADVLLVSLADKVHNARSILRDLRKPDVGEAVWNRFDAGKAKSFWYYRQLANQFRRRPGGNSLKSCMRLLSCWSGRRLMLSRSFR